MVITNTKYLQDLVAGVNNAVKATIDGEVLNIPMDTGNRHYAEILKQVADGDITIAEAD
jgi:hypothetical protein